MEKKQDHLMSVVVDQPGDFWRDSAIAERYEPERFQNLKGWLYKVLEERVLRRALKYINTGSRLLDEACGTGRVTRLLDGAGYRVVGCDISLAMMSIAKRQFSAGGKERSFTQGDGTQLPFKDKAFDAVTCVGLLMHLDAARRVHVLKELARVSQGYIVVQYGCVSALLSLIARIVGRNAGNVRHPVDDTELRKDLEGAALKEVDRFWAQWPLSSSLVLVLSRTSS